MRAASVANQDKRDRLLGLGLSGRAMKTTEDRQLIQDSIYAEAYRAWVESLPPDERAELESCDLDKSDTSRRTNSWDDELAMQLASTNEIAWPIASGGIPDGLDDSAGRQDRMDVGVALAAFCARVRAHPNPLLALDTLCFATGLMGLEGRSQAELAALHGVTRAAFSKQVLAWLDIFELSPPRGCRSLRVRQALSRAERPRQVRVAPDGGDEATASPRRRNRYPAKSADMTVVFIHGLDLFRRWFRQRCRKLPLRRWSPQARAVLRVELGWFARLHAQLEQDMRQKPPTR